MNRSDLSSIGISSLPKIWKISSLGHLGVFSKGTGILRDQSNSGTIPAVRYGEIYTLHGEVIRSFGSHISLDVAQTAQRIRKGDILFAASGETKAEIGKCTVLNESIVAYAGGDIIVFSPNGDCDPVFLSYLLNSPVAAKQKAGLGQGDAIVHIHAKNLGNVLVPMPPLHEQRAIAEALGDVDAQLGALDRLIAKKRDLKQAAMQQLLATTSSSGFRSATAFGDLVMLVKDMTAVGEDDPPVECIELDDIVAGTGRVQARRPFVGFRSAKNKFKLGDVLFGKLRAYLRKYWLADRAGVCSTEIWVLRPASRIVDSGYVRYLVESEPFIEMASVSHGTHMPRSDWKVIKNYPVIIPPLIKQREIGIILCNMDREIELLSDLHAKTAEVKTGMMQSLLTGKVRLA